MWVICASPTSLGVPMPSSLSLITPTPFHLLFPSPRFLRYNKQAPHSSRHHLLVQIRSVRRQGCALVCPRSAPCGKVRCLTSQQSQPPLHSCQSVVLCLLVPRWSSILADFLCAIRFTFVLACLIVEVVTTCAACMWVICASPISLCVCPCLFSKSHIHTSCVLVL
jgi:hypothetical protein